MKNRNAPSEPELSRPLRIEKISPNGVEETIIASEKERQVLAERFDLVEIKNLTARLCVKPERAVLNFAVNGKLVADVVQSCVVTLEPLPAHVEQNIGVHFASPEFFQSGGATERDVEEDDMEPINDGIIDLGELVAQHLGLGLDPYPRKEGLPPVEVEFGEPLVKDNPFAKLVVLKDKTKD